MDNLIIFSVIIPVYNCEKYIERAIQSIIKQPGLNKNYEIIVVDDGSTDNTADICDRLAKEHSEIVVIHRENSGVAKTRNFALSIAKGKYVNFMDSDDWWNENVIDDTVINGMISENYNIINFAHQDVSTNYKYRKIYYPIEGSYKDRCFQTKFYLLSFLKKNDITFLNLIMREDRFFLENAYNSSGKGGDYCYKSVLYCYWMNPDSVCHSSFNPNKFKTKISRYLDNKDYIVGHKFFNEKSFDEDIKKQVVSAISDCCATNSLKFTQEYFNDETFNIMNDNSVKIWSTLEKSLQLWNNHPRLFHIKSKFVPGLRFLFRNIRLKSRLAMNLYEIVYFKYKQKWENNPNYK